MIQLGGGWDELLAPLFADERYKKIREFLKDEYSHHVIYPNMYDLYNCFRYTPLNEVRAVILGQDPYHNEGQAHGLCFSVKRGVQIPPSLVNIYKEIETDLGITEPNCGDLTKWARGGVLLLSEQKRNLVFLLWGGNARSKAPLIDQGKHLILQAPHPSPLSAYNGFFGCRHFSKTNAYLLSHGRQPIDWDLN